MYSCQFGICLQTSGTVNYYYLISFTVYEWVGLVQILLWSELCLHQVRLASKLCPRPAKSEQKRAANLHTHYSEFCHYNLNKLLMCKSVIPTNSDWLKNKISNLDFQSMGRIGVNGFYQQYFHQHWSMQ